MMMPQYFVISLLLFSLEPTVSMDTCMRTTSITVMVNFRKCYSEGYLITAMFKVRSQQLQGTLTIEF